MKIPTWKNRYLHWFGTIHRNYADMNWKYQRRTHRYWHWYCTIHRNNADWGWYNTKFSPFIFNIDGLWNFRCLDQWQIVQLQWNTHTDIIVFIIPIDILMTWQLHVIYNKLRIQIFAFKWYSTQNYCWCYLQRIAHTDVYISVVQSINTNIADIDIPASNPKKCHFYTFLGT